MEKAVSVSIKRNPPVLTQSTNHVLMIEPVAFGQNTQTAEDNHFQSQTSGAQRKALAEFQNLATTLTEHGVNVITFKDSLLPHTPDTIFPNHAVTFHENGKAFVYPLRATNRRGEISNEKLNEIKQKGFVLKEIYDMKPLTESSHYLEGAGSMVFDRINRIVYGCYSERTSERWFKRTCKRLRYKPMLFSAKQNVTWKRQPIHHTNMMMTLGEGFAVICLDSIDDEKERQAVVDSLDNSKKHIIEISEKQMQQFAGNMVQLRTDKDTQILLMSTRAFNSLNEDQITMLEFHCPIVHVDISTIENNGGCSVGSMVAEIFLPQRRAQHSIKVSV